MKEFNNLVEKIVKKYPKFSLDNYDRKRTERSVCEDIPVQQDFEISSISSKGIVINKPGTYSFTNDIWWELFCTLIFRKNMEK